MIVDIRNICICYNLFIISGTGFLLIRIYPKFVSIIKASFIIENDFDYCRCINTSFQFCKSCYKIIIEKKISKFGSNNYINILICQKYFNILNNLVLVEKAFITCVYPIKLIIKLKLSDFDSFAL